MNENVTVKEKKLSIVKRIFKTIMLLLVVALVVSIVYLVIKDQKEKQIERDILHEEALKTADILERDMGIRYDWSYTYYISEQLIKLADIPLVEFDWERTNLERLCGLPEGITWRLIDNAMDDWAISYGDVHIGAFYNDYTGQDKKYAHSSLDFYNQVLILEYDFTCEKPWMQVANTAWKGFGGSVKGPQLLTYFFEKTATGQWAGTLAPSEYEYALEHSSNPSIQSRNIPAAAKYFYEATWLIDPLEPWHIVIRLNDVKDARDVDVKLKKYDLYRGKIGDESASTKDHYEIAKVLEHTKENYPLDLKHKPVEHPVHYFDSTSIGQSDWAYYQETLSAFSKENKNGLVTNGYSEDDPDIIKISFNDYNDKHFYFKDANYTYYYGEVHRSYIEVYTGYDESIGQDVIVYRYLDDETLYKTTRIPSFQEVYPETTWKMREQDW